MTFPLHPHLDQPPAIRTQVKFDLGAHLLPSAEEAVKEIPGVYYFKRGRRPAVAITPDGALPVEQTLCRHGVRFEPRIKRNIRDAVRFQADTDWAAEIAAGIPELKPEIPGASGMVPLWIWLAGFQREWLTRSWAWGGIACHQSPGAGKTVQMVLWGLAYPDPIVVVTKAAVREQFAKEYLRFTTVRPFVVRPTADRDAGGLGAYLASCEPYRNATMGLAYRKRPVIVLAWNNLVDWHTTLIETLGSFTLILDEIHLGRARKRAKWTPSATGTGYDKRVILNQSSAAEILAKAAARTCGGTATDVFDKLPDLWGQNSLIQPKGWGGTANRFLFRYCDAKQSETGPGLVYTGQSNNDELRHRMKYTAHRTPYAVSHADLPDKRRDVVYITIAEQNRAGAFTTQLRDAKRRGKQDEQAVRVAMAASRKRNYVRDIIVERLEAGQKVIVLDSWRKNADRLFEAIAKKWKGAVTPDRPPKVVNISGLDPKAAAKACDVYAGRAKHIPYGWRKLGKDGELGNYAGTLDRYPAYLERKLREPAFRDLVRGLGGKRLGCFCAPEPCHCDILVEWWKEDAAREDRQNLFLGHGGVPYAERNRVKELWMGDIDGSRDAPPLEGPACIIGTHQAIGTGLNWHDTDLLAWSALPVSPGELWQGENRVSRRGQRRKTHIMYFVAEGTYDERIAEILLPKFAAVEAVGGPDEIRGVGEQLEGVEDEEGLIADLLDALEAEDE